MKQFLKQNASTILFLLFVLFVPLSGGLFYKGALYSSLILLCILTLFLFARVQKVNIDLKLFALFALQLIFGSISSVRGINTEEAIFGFFKILFIPLAFVLALNMQSFKINRIDRNDEPQSPFEAYRLLMAFLFISGVTLSLINLLLNFMKSSNLKSYRADAILGYANTLALVAFISSVIGFYFYYSEDRSRLHRVAIKMGIFFNVTVLILTFSRTMWVLSFFLYAFFLFSIRKRGNMIDAVLLISVSAVSAIAVTSGNRLISGPAFFIFLILLVYYEYTLRTKFISLLGYNDFWRKKALTKGLFAVFVLILAAAVSSLGSATLARRVASIGFGATELQERFAYYRDALAIIKKYLLFGTGSGGWSSIQFKYQTALYSVQYAHSSIFQRALDYGISGLLVFGTEIAVFVVYVHKSLKKTASREMKNAIILAAVCNSAILLHSLIDFDFEFSLITMIFWINVAFLSRVSGSTRPIRLFSGRNGQGIKKAGLVRITVLSILILLVVALIPLYLSNTFYLKGAALYNKKNFTHAEACLDKAIFLNPFSSKACHAKAKALLKGQTEKISISDFKRVEKLIWEAEKHDSFNPAYAETLADAYDTRNNFEGSTTEYRKLIHLSPMRINYYEGLSESLMAMAETDLRSGKNGKANVYLNQVTELIKCLQEAHSRISPSAGKLKHKLVLKITPELAYNIGRAYLFLNDEKKAAEYLKMASEGKDIPKSWLIKNINTLRKGTS